jgi:hypothetical protein
MSHFVFNLADLRFDDRKGLFNLEVCNLRNHRFDLIFDFFDKFPSFRWIQFGRALGNHHLLDNRLASKTAEHLTTTLAYHCTMA